MTSKRQQQWLAGFVHSCGGILLASAVALSLANRAGAGLVHAHDPVFGLPLPDFFWLLAGIQLAVALVCLLGRSRPLQLGLILWLGLDFLVYLLALPFLSVTAGLKGYLGDFTEAFGISCATTNLLLHATVLYLFLGSVVCLAWTWVGQRRAQAHPTAKMACAQCGGHVEFELRNLGQIIPCPHCRAAVTLRKPGENLKMACFFCRGHIEFPPHAIGQKLKCPHCHKDITLKEPAEKCSL